MACPDSKNALRMNGISAAAYYWPSEAPVTGTYFLKRKSAIDRWSGFVNCLGFGIESRVYDVTKL